MSRGAGGAETSVGDSGHPEPAESAAGGVMDFRVGTERPSAGPKATVGWGALAPGEGGRKVRPNPGHWVAVREHRGTRGQAEPTLELLPLPSAPLASPRHGSHSPRCSTGPRSAPASLSRAHCAAWSEHLRPVCGDTGTGAESALARGCVCGSGSVYTHG